MKHIYQILEESGSCCSECELDTLTIAVALMKNDECSEHTCFMGATITKWLHMGKYFMYMILLSSPANEWNTGPRYYCSHICKWKGKYTSIVKLDCIEEKLCKITSQFSRYCGNRFKKVMGLNSSALQFIEMRLKAGI